MANAMQYIANLGKSVVYSGVDQIKKNNPAIAEIAEQNAELGKVLYQSVSDFKSTQVKIGKWIRNTQIGEAAIEGKKALFEDIQSGKFYNRERIDQLQVRSAGSLLSGWDDDDPFDNLESDFGGDWDDDSSDSDFDPLADIGNDDMFLADQMDNTGSKVTQGVAMATARSAEYVVGATRENTNLINKHSEMMFNKVHMGMSAMNSNISSLITFNDEVMKTHVQNSEKFFSDTSTRLKNIEGYLKTMSDAQAKLYASSESKSSSENVSYGDIVGAEGTADLKQYFNRIKQNVANKSGGMFDMLNVFGEDSNMLLNLVSSPLKFVTDNIARTVIPSILDQSMQSLNETISGFFGNAMLKLNTLGGEDSEDPVWQFLKGVLGIDTRAKTKMDTAKYNKGAMPWDGESKMALTQVIPQLLSKILSATSGTEERIFDYKNGKWTTGTAIKKSYDDRKEGFQKSATADAKEALLELLEQPGIKFDKKFNDQIKEGIDTMLKSAYENNILLPVNMKNDFKTREKYGNIDSEVMDYLIALTNAMKRSEKGRKALNGFGDKVLSQKDAENQFMTSEVESISSEMRTIFNEYGIGEFVKKEKEDEKGNKKNVDSRENISSPIIANNIFNTKDEHGNNVFFYLQNIDRVISYMGQNFDKLGTGSGPNYGAGNGGFDAHVDKTPSLIQPLNNFKYELADRRNSLNDVKEKETKAKQEKQKREQEAFEKNYDRELAKDYVPTTKGYKRLKEYGPDAADNRMVNLGNGYYKHYSWDYNDNRYNYTEKNYDISKNPNFAVNNAYNDRTDRMKVAEFEQTLRNNQERRNLEQQRKADKRRRGGSSTDIDDLSSTVTSAEEGHRQFTDIILGIGELSQAPAKFIGNLIHKVDKRLFQVIYGNEKEDKIEENSFMGALVSRMNRTFDDVSSFFRDKIMDPLKEKLFGEDGFGGFFDKLKELWNGDDEEDGILKRMFGNKVEFVKNAFKEKFSPIKGGLKGELKDGLEIPEGMTMEEYRKRWIQDEKYKRERAKKLEFAKRTKAGYDNIMQIQKGLNDSYMDDNGNYDGDITKDISRIREIKNIKHFKDFARLTPSTDKEKDILRKTGRVWAKDRRESRQYIREAMANGASAQYLADHGYADLIDQMSKRDKNIAEWAKDVNVKNYNDIRQHYKGTGYVEKTGIAAVSEGEMIIPAEYNPFYKGGKSRYQRKMDEEQAKHNFVDFLNSIKSHKNINGFVEGTTNATEEKSRSQTIREAFSRLGDRIYKEKDEAGLSMEDDGEVPVDPDDLNAAFYDAHYKKGKLPFHERVRREGKYIAKKGKLTGKDLLRRFAKNSSRIDTAYRKIADEMEDAAGEENQAELWDEMVDDVAGNYKEYIPSMVGGGLIGSGISLVTGAIGGPLLGFAVGAGIDLITRSNKVKDWLFGKQDEDGNRHGNVLNESITKFITRYVPDMAKGATVGAITHILPFVPGGPVSGIILGSAIGFAKNNDKIMSALFGEMDDEGNRTQGGLINSKLRTQLKNALPRMAIGGAIGAFTGPFGLMGNILLGSTIGFASKLDTAKDFIFGKLDEETGERKGGVFGYIEDRVIEPIGRAFDPLVKQGEKLFKGFSKHITDKVDGILEEKLGVPLSRIFKEKGLEKIKGAAKFIGNNLFMPTMDMITSPLQIIEKLGDRFRRKHIANGDADYMTALQRNEYRQELKDHKVYKKYEENVYDKDGKLVHRKGDLMKDDHGNYIDTGKKKSYVYKRIKKDKYKKFDELLADRTTSYDELVEMRDALSFLQDPDKQVKKMKKDSIHNINKAINKNFNIGISDSKDILGHLSDNDFKGAMRKVRRLGLDSKTEQRLTNLLTNEYTKLESANDMLNNEQATKDKYFKRLRANGLKDLNQDTIKKYAGLLDDEIDNKKKMGLDKLNDEMQTRHNEITGLFRDLIDEVKALRDPEHKKELFNNKLHDNMKEAAKRRGIFFDSGNSGVFGRYKYEADIDSNGQPVYKRYKVDKKGRKIEDSAEIINSKGQVLNSNGEVDPDKNGEEYWDDLQRRYHGSNLGDAGGEGGIRNAFGRLQAGRRTKARTVYDAIRHFPRNAANAGDRWADDRYTQNEYDDDGNLIHVRGEYREIEGGKFKRGLGWAGRGYGRARRYLGQNLFHLNKSEEYQSSINKARDFRADEKMYKNAYSNQMKAIHKIMKNKNGEYTEEEARNAENIYNQLKANRKNNKGSNQALFANSNELFRKVFGNRQKLDGSGSEEADEDTMYVANSKGNPIKWIKDSQGHWTVDRNDSDNNVYEDDEEKGFKNKLLGKFADIGNGIKNGFNRIFKIDEEKDTLLKKLLKVGAGVLGALTVAGFMPIIERAWNNRIKPGLQEIWDEKIYPKIYKFIEPIKPTLARAAAGIDNTIQKIPTAIDNLATKVRMFITNDLPNIWTQKIIPFYKGGIDWIGEKVGNAVSGLSYTVMKLMPHIIKGAIQGVWQFMKQDLTAMILGKNNGSAEDILNLASSASMKTASGNAGAFGGTSAETSMKNFNKASSIYQALFHETPQQTLGTNGSTKASSDDSRRNSLENYYNMTGSYPSDDELGQFEAEENIGMNNTSTSAGDNGMEYSGNVYDVGSNISGSEAESYSYSVASSGSNNTSSINSAVYDEYDKQYEEAKTTQEKVNKAVKESTDNQKTSVKNSATQVTVKAGETVNRGNFNIQPYNSGVQDLATTGEKTRSQIANHWATKGSMDRNDNAVSQALYNVGDKAKNLFSSITGNLGAIAHNASYGGIQAYDTSVENATTQVGGRLSGGYVDTNTCLVYDSDGLLLANTFYDPENNEITNKPSDAAFAKNSNLIEMYNSELSRSVKEAGIDAYQYSNGAAYLDENGLLAENVTEVAESDPDFEDTVGGHLVGATLRITSPLNALRTTSSRNANGYLVKKLAGKKFKGKGLITGSLAKTGNTINNITARPLNALSNYTNEEKFVHIFGKDRKVLGSGYLDKLSNSKFNVAGKLQNRIKYGTINELAQKTNLSRDLAENTIKSLKNVTGSEFTDAKSKKLLNKLVSQTDKVTKEVLQESSEKVVKNNVDTAVGKIMGNGQVKGILEKLIKMSGKEVSEEMVEKGIKQAAEEVTEHALKNAANAGIKGALASTGVGILVNIALAIPDFVEGFNNADEYMGLTEKYFDEYLPSAFGEWLVRFLCGLGNALIGFFALGLIPMELVINILLKYVAPIFGFDYSKLEALQKESAKEIATFNSYNNTNFDLEEYNKHKDETKYKANERKLGTKGQTAIDRTISKENNNRIDSMLEGKKIEHRTYADFDIFQGGSGSGIAKSTDFVSSKETLTDKLISQLDPKYKDIKFNSSEDTVDQTIGSDGCAPAVATMAINKVKENAGLDIKTAADIAIEEGDKIKDGGVSAKYFNDIYQKYGLGALYSDDRKEIKDSISKGLPVVLLGTNESNNSKSISPFGPNGHYVLTNGTSGNDVFVQDPEQSKVVSYKLNDLINQTKLAVIPGSQSSYSSYNGKYDEYSGSGSGGTYYIPGTTTNISFHNNNFNSVLNTAYQMTGSYSGSGSGIKYSAGNTNQVFSKNGAITPNIIRGKNTTNVNITTDKFIGSGSYKKYSAGAANNEDYVEDDAVSNAIYGQNLEGNALDNMVESGYNKVKNTAQNIGKKVGVTVSGLTKNNDGSTTIDINQSNNYLNEMIVVISQMKGSMSFSAIKVGKSSNSYGIFLWSGNDGAQLLFDTYAAEKEKWTNKLATSGAALFKSIKSKKPLSKSTTGKYSQKKLIAMISSDEGKTNQINKATNSIISVINKYKERFSDIKALMFITAIHFIDSNVAQGISSTKRNKLAKDSSMDHIMMILNTDYSDFLTNKSKDINFAYYYIQGSPVVDMNATAPDLAKLEENISTAKVDDKDSNWFSNFFSGIVDLGKSLFGLNTDEDSKSSNLEAKDYNLAAVDTTGVYIEDLNNDFKTLSYRLTSLKSLHNKLKTDSGDEDLANKLAIIYFESSSLFTFLVQFDKFKDDYGVEINSLSLDYNYSVGNSNYIVKGIKSYATKNPCVSDDDMKAVGSAWNADLKFSSSNLSDKDILANAKNKWKVLEKIKSQDYVDEKIKELDSYDYSHDNPYQYQTASDNASDINLIGLFEDQLVAFMVNGTAKDLNGVTIVKGIKKDNKDYYTTVMDAFNKNSNSGSGPFKNNFFNQVIINNMDLLSNLKSKNTRKGIISYLREYIMGSLLTDASEHKFYNPEQLAKDDLKKHWETLGSSGSNIDAKISAWGEAADIIENAFQNNITSDFISGLNTHNKNLGLNEVKDFNFMTSQIYTDSNPFSYVNNNPLLKDKMVVNEDKLQQLKVSNANKISMKDSGADDLAKSYSILNKMVGSSYNSLDSKKFYDSFSSMEKETKEKNTLNYNGSIVYNPYIMKKTILDSAKGIGSKKVSMKTKQTNGHRDNSRSYSVALETLAKSRYLMKTAGAVLPISKKKFLDKYSIFSDIIKKRKNDANYTTTKDIYDIGISYDSDTSTKFQDLSDLKLTYPDENASLYFKGTNEDSDVINDQFMKAVSFVGFTNYADGKSPSEMIKNNEILNQLFGNSTGDLDNFGGYVFGGSSLIDSSFDNEEKKAFLDYYNTLFKADKSNTGISNKDQSDIMSKDHAEIFKNLNWNATSYFDALNKKVAYNDMYGDTISTGDVEKSPKISEYMKEKDKIDNNYLLHALIAKELLNNDSAKFNDDLPIASNIADSKELLSFDNANSSDGKSNDDNIKDSEVRRLFNLYTDYHYADYYEPGFIGKRFYEKYAANIKPVEDANGQQVSNESASTQQISANLSSAYDALQKAYMENSKGNSDKINMTYGVTENPDESMANQLKDGTAKLSDYKKYYAWLVKEGYVPKDKEDTSEPTLYGGPPDKPSEYNWDYLAAYSGDKKGDIISYAISKGIIPAFYKRADYLTDPETGSWNSKLKAVFVNDGLEDKFKSVVTGKEASLIPDSYGSMKSLFNDQTPFTDNSVENKTKLALNMQNAFSPYSFDEWKAIYDSYSTDELKKAFAEFGDVNGGDENTPGELKNMTYWKEHGNDYSNKIGGFWFTKTDKNLYAFDDIKNLFEQSDAYKNLVNSGAGSGLPSAGSSNIDGFVSQYDYGNQTFADGTSLAEYGCGPAVAAMAINNMQSAGDSSLMNATAAIANGYKDSNGTQADYFQDVFSRVGANTQYYDGASTKQNVENSLNAGQQVVLMGNDASNRSKNNSPYGPSNHYVLATGMNGNKIQINDPEQGAPRVYDKNKILNKTQLGVAVSGAGYMAKSRIGSKVYRYSGGAAKKSLKHANLGSWSKVSEEELNAAIKRINSSSPFNGNAAIFIEAGEKSGLDPRYILAHAAVEAGWECKSTLAKKHNYFGIAAYDSNPVNSKSTETYGNGNMREGIINGAVWIKNHYYNNGQTTVYLMRHWEKNPHHQYCTSDTWEDSIASIMKKLPVNTEVSYDETSLDTEERIGVPSTGDSGSLVNLSTNSSGSNKSSGSWYEQMNNGFEQLGKALFGMQDENKTTDNIGATTADAISASTADFSTGETNGTWISVIKAVKSALAKAASKYDRRGHVSITIDGIPYTVRTDCSGFVSACCRAFGVLDGEITSSQFTSMKTLSGFEKRKWKGWDNLIEGDIIARDGHVEIFARNEGGTHYVYNAGSTNSITNPDATTDPDKKNKGYSVVWRCIKQDTSSANKAFKKAKNKAKKYNKDSNEQLKLYNKLKKKKESALTSAEKNFIALNPPTDTSNEGERQVWQQYYELAAGKKTTYARPHKINNRPTVAQLKTKTYEELVKLEKRYPGIITQLDYKTLAKKVEEAKKRGVKIVNTSTTVKPTAKPSRGSIPSQSNYSASAKGSGLYSAGNSGRNNKYVRINNISKHHNSTVSTTSRNSGGNNHNKFTKYSGGANWYEQMNSDIANKLGKSFGMQDSVNIDVSGLGEALGFSSSSSASASSNGSWISIVKATKKAMADAMQNRQYNQGASVKLTVDGKTLSVRTDCSGLVSGCLRFFGAMNNVLNSSGFCSAKSIKGFTKMSWPGWDGLVEGDIIARNGHVEIFARNEGGTHYVYNGGSTKSLRSADATVTGHSSYTTVWRCNSGSGSHIYKFSGMSAGNSKAITNQIFNTKANGSKHSVNESGTSSYIRKTGTYIDNGIVGKLTNGYGNNTGNTNTNRFNSNTVRSAINNSTSSSMSTTTRQVLNSIGKSGYSESFKNASGGNSKVYYENNYSQYSAGASNGNEAMLAKAIELLAKITNNTANIKEVITILNRIMDIAKNNKSSSGKGSNVNHKPATTRADRERKYSGGNSNIGASTAGNTSTTSTGNSGSSNSDNESEQELQLLLKNLSELVRG